MTDSEDIRLVSDVIQSFIKAKKNLRIYPTNNPIYTKTVEAVYRKFMKVFDIVDSISLRFTRSEILWGDAKVFAGTGKDDNLALFFSRDGMKEITFQKDIQPDEFKEFLEIIAFDFESEDVVDDVVTLMWEKDFRSIRYTVDESILTEEEEDYEQEAVRQAKENAADADDLARAYTDALRGEEAEEVTLIPITDKDLKAVVGLIERAKQDKRDKLVDILLDMLRQAGNFYEFHEIVGILENTMEYSVKQGDINIAVEILHRAQEFDVSALTEFDCTDEIQRIFTFAGSAEMIKIIGELMDTESGIEEHIFNSYASFLPRESVPHFITILGELKTIGARKNVINALTFLGGKDISVLAGSLADSRWYVVRNIIYVLRKIGDPSAVTHLMKAAGHNDVRVRKEVLKTLGDLGGEKAAGVLRTFLTDPNVSVRSTAVRALGSTETDFAKAALLQRVSEPAFLFAEFSEKKECFEVLATWKDDDVFDLLMKILKKRSFFRRAKHNEMKTAASYALGLIGNKDAIAALEKLRKSKNRTLSEYAYAAVKRIEYGKQG